MGRGSGSGGHSSGRSHSHSSGSRGSSHSHSSRSSGRGSSSFHSSGRSYRSSSSGYRSSPIFRSGGYRSYGGYSPMYGGGGGFYGFGRFRVISSMIVVLLMILCVAVLWAKSGSSLPASTTQRTKAESGNAFVSDCVIDEIGWISNPNKVSSQLKEFYIETGCQPYILLKQYDASLTTAEACEAWSKDYYDSHFALNQNVVLYTYFCDEFDDGEGIDTLFVGTQSGLVFDSEAQEIFWAVLDYDWDTWDTEDNDGMFVDVFTKTAKRIMTVTTTANDVKKVIAIVFGVIGVGVIAVTLITKKYRREKEKALETERILKTPVSDLEPSDDLADKYMK